MPRSPIRSLLLLVVISLLLVGPGLPDVSTAADAAVDPALYQALEYRFVGPYRGGRSGTVAGIPDQPHTFFMGTAGGVFKTVNAGQDWEPITDGQLEVGSIGAVAVAPSDTSVIYVGTGQKTVRANVSIGKGMYKSTDGGRTWRHVGLRDAGQISQVLIHPDDPDLVYVGAIGNPFAPNETRGVFRSRDGGDSWDKVLDLGERTGIADLVMDSHNPRVLYAAGWTGERKPWTIISGGGEDGLYKSTDGGDSWRKLGGGLPEGLVGKIGIAVSGADPDRLYALVEAEPEVAGLYRSDDAGETWEHMETNQGRALYTRSWYYTHIYADPVDVNRVYALAVNAYVSTDGGRTFEQFDTPHGDHHDMWINPNDPNIVAIADDGGAQISLDRTATWSTYHNQPTAEIYYVFVDNLFPYNVYGSQQDNSTFRMASRFDGHGLTPWEYWEDVGGCESAHIGFDPDDPRVVWAGCYAGHITRYDTVTHDSRDVLVYPQMEFGEAPRNLRYRFNWSAPIRVSPHDSTVAYHASQHVHRTDDGGQSWETISPDLTTDDLETQDYSGAPITRENTGAEVYNTIFAFEESEQVPGLLWAGSDDGLVHVSEDDGDTWRDVTPAGLPPRGTVNIIELSAHDPDRVFVAVKAYMLDDWEPYVFRTNDMGATWERLTDGTNGIPADTPVRVVREDPEVRGLLYAGTEFGMYVSFDDGASWQGLQLNLPEVPITDLRVHRGDLVVATQGRGIWILDDVTPLRELAEGAATDRLHLFAPRDTVRMDLGGASGPEARRGENPPEGVMIRYALPEDPGEQELTLDIIGPDGQVIRHYSSTRDPEPNPETIWFADRGQVRLDTEPGMNDFVWNFRYPPVQMPSELVIYGLTGGPRAAPGTYRARLSLGDEVREAEFRIVPDPRLDVPQAAYDEQLELSLSLRGELVRLFDALRTVRSVREQVDTRMEQLEAADVEVADLRDTVDGLQERLEAVEEELVQPRNEAFDDVENFPQKLAEEIAYLYYLVDDSQHRPTDGQAERAAELREELDAVLGTLDGVLEEVAAFGDTLQARGATPIIVPR